ncbi:MAG: hypothetical protein QM765_34140 [Myxococcales bacterium]
MEVALGRGLAVIEELNLRGESSPELASALLDVPPLALAVVAQRFRASATLSPFGAMSWSSRAADAAVDAAVSLQRNGRARELAVQRLAAAAEPKVVPFLLLRLDDIVPAVRASAAEAVLSRLQAENAPTFARCLGLLAVLARRQRGQAAAAVRGVREFLASPEQWRLLADQFRDPDGTTRLEAFKLALTGDPDVVLLALADSDPGVRRWAMRTLCSRQVSSEVRHRGLPFLESSRDARVRLMALKARAPELSAGALEARWLFDAHSSVRLEARKLLTALAPDRPVTRSRELAIAALKKPETPAAVRVGALGTIADLGRSADIALVAPFLDEPGAVRREAKRTLRILETLGT